MGLKRHSDIDSLLLLASPVNPLNTRLTPALFKLRAPPPATIPMELGLEPVGTSSESERDLPTLDALNVGIWSYASTHLPPQGDRIQCKMYLITIKARHRSTCNQYTCQVCNPQNFCKHFRLSHECWTCHVNTKCRMHGIYLHNCRDCKKRPHGYRALKPAAPRS